MGAGVFIACALTLHREQVRMKRRLCEKANAYVLCTAHYPTLQNAVEL